MIGLCIAESNYLLGRARLVWFEKEQFMIAYRAKLDQSVTTWLVGQPEPKRKQLGTWF